MRVKKLTPRMRRLSNVVALTYERERHKRSRNLRGRRKYFLKPKPADYDWSEDKHWKHYVNTARLSVSHNIHPELWVWIQFKHFDLFGSWGFSIQPCHLGSEESWNRVTAYLKKAKIFGMTLGTRVADELDSEIIESKARAERILRLRKDLTNMTDLLKKPECCMVLHKEHIRELPEFQKLEKQRWFKRVGKFNPLEICGSGF